MKPGSAAPIHGRLPGIREWRAGFFAFSIVFATFTSAVTAGEADVVDVKIVAETGGTYRFDVTAEHADEGWETTRINGTCSTMPAMSSGHANSCTRM
ncbi:hypothetical protein A33O_00085 [Nitratireductor aquibiodomus RA22]|uniref:Uncharacterized protein n=1 Tax=Nitratireductor aquibiodomus RA22 TaxID=1189611 RepID=I5C8J3_9HYPH|nr:hypothetical protein A33O_00085 [Nitratireductor aquibiodomus RA22]